MIEILIDGKVQKVNPEMTIELYQTIQKNPKRYTDPTEMLALYLGITVDELRDLPVDQIRFVEGVLSSHILRPNPDDVVFTFQHEGITYGLENDWGNMKWGQWVDLEVFSQQDRITDSIHIIMALLYRPVILENGTEYKLSEFKSSEVMERAEIFRKNLPVAYWFGCANFFFLIAREFISNIENSTRAKMKLIKLMTPITRYLPKWLLPKVLRDFTSNSLTNSLKKT